jgi:glycosyltransferase involved in cell wall biosynthesis
MSDWQKHTTVIVKTGGRPKCLADLVATLREHWPGVPVHVADDGIEPSACSGADRILRLPYDTGLSTARNLLLAAVETRCVLLLDDDMLVEPDTDIGVLYGAVAGDGWDLAAGTVHRPPEHHYPAWRGSIRIENGACHLLPGPAEDEPGRYHLVENFFLADTEALKGCPWDPALKIGEHLDWCFRAKYDAGLRMTWRPGCEITDTQSLPTPQYEHLRRRAPRYGRAALERWARRLGFSQLINHFYPEGNVVLTD